MAGSGPFESRLYPIRRSSHSFFEPSWQVGPWNDFGTQNYRSHWESRPHAHTVAVPAPAGTGSMTNYFDQKMRDMESQMDQMFRSFNQLMPAASAMPPSLQPPPMTPSSSTALMPQFPQVPAMMNMPFPAMPHGFEQMKIDNPYVTDAQGNRKLQLQFDVRQFKPEEIQVKTENRQLCVHARHEQKGDGSQVMREYQRFFLLPENLEPEKLSSVLSPEGILSIEAPMPALEAPKEKTEVLIPIMHK